MLSFRWVGHGDDALDALDERIGRARTGGALAPVTVVTPTPAVAVAARRALARRSGAVVGVGFHSLGAVAEMVAGPELARAGIDIGVDRELVVAAVRRVLASNPGYLGPIKHHRSTWETLARTIGDLGQVETGRLGLIDSRDEVVGEVHRVAEAVRAMVGVNGPHAVLHLAVEVLEAGDATGVEPLGPIIVYLPDVLSSLEQRFVSALHQRVDVTMLLGATGDPAADAVLHGGLTSLGPPPPESHPAPAPTTVLSVNDIDDEVRVAVRHLVALADDGVPINRMALVHPPGAPYARIVADVVRSTGLPFSGPSTHTLGETVVGRVLTRTLAVVRSGLARPEVINLWSTGVVVADDGAPLPFARFDERSRRFGAIRGLAEWHDALDRDEQRLANSETNGDSESVEHGGHMTAMIRTSIETLGAMADAFPDDWSEVANWAGTVIESLCGPRVRRSWPDVEFTAEDALLTALGRLAALTQVEHAPNVALVAETIGTVLDQPAPRASGTGTGLLIATLDDPPLVPLDAVAILGCVEGYAPRVPREDVLLGDAVRHELGLPTSDDHHDRQHRAFQATLASARHHRVVSFARHDQRSGRWLVPSRWLINGVQTKTGDRPDVEALMAGDAVVGVDVVASYSDGLAAMNAEYTPAMAALHTAERTLADLVNADAIDGHPAVDDALQRGATLIRSRASRSFTRFDGDVGVGPDVTAMGVLSPTSLETYASCPRRWLFEHGLLLRPVDRPEEIDRIQPRDKGTLVHKVLERFFKEMLALGAVPPPNQPWPPSARSRLAQLGAEECDRFERSGRTGHPRRWAHDQIGIGKLLDLALDGDVALRGQLGVNPVAVEFSFGRNGAPPLRINLGDGRVIALSGQADRVDIGPDRAVVWDYKVSGSDSYKVLVKDEAKGGDPLGFGTKLQLVAYAMAAGLVHDTGGSIHASYWFLSERPKDTNRRIGYPITAELESRFRSALQVLADGIGAGRFPARPGDYRFHRRTFDHCSFCDFDRICPSDRDEEWERVRFDPGLGPLRTLVEEGSASLVAAHDHDHASARGEPR